MRYLNQKAFEKENEDAKCKRECLEFVVGGSDRLDVTSGVELILHSENAVPSGLIRAGSSDHGGASTICCS